MPLDASVAELLSCMVERFVAPEGECQCALGEEGALVCCMKNRTVYIQGESRVGLASQRLPLAGGMPLVEAMLLLQGYAHRPSKVSFAADAQAALGWLADVIHADVEASRDDERWAKASHTLLPRMGGEKRARRIPLGSKLDIAKEVSECPNIRSVQQFIASQKLRERLDRDADDDDDEDAPHLKRRRLPSSAIAEPKSALNWHRDRMVAYMLTGRLELSGTSVLGVSVDGSRVGNRELQLGAAWSAEKSCGVWLPPQVLGLSGGSDIVVWPTLRPAQNPPRTHQFCNVSSTGE